MGPPSKTELALIKHLANSVYISTEDKKKQLAAANKQAAKVLLLSVYTPSPGCVTSSSTVSRNG